MARGAPTDLGYGLPMKLRLVAFFGLVSFLACGGTKPSEIPLAASPPTSANDTAEPLPAPQPAALVGAAMCSLREPHACVPACDAGDAEACFLAGQGFHQLPEGQRDDQKAVSAYRRGCDLDKPEACGNLGLQYEKGWGIAQDIAKAAALYEKACAAEVVVACRNVGKLNEGESGYPADPGKSAAAYQRALTLALALCDHGRAEGCVAAGYMFQDGKGTSVDQARGDELVRKACSMGYSWACKARETK